MPTWFEVEVLVTVKNRTTGKRYSMLARRKVEGQTVTHSEILADMVQELNYRPLTPRMVDVERREDEE